MGVCVFLLGTPVIPAITAEQIQMPFGGAGALRSGARWLHDGMICAAVAMWAAATITITTYYI